MSEAKVAFHGCFKPCPAILQFICHVEIKAGPSWYIDIFHAADESGQRLIFFSSTVSVVT